MIKSMRRLTAHAFFVVCRAGLWYSGEERFDEK
jgi:hypothetical protein